MSATRTNLILVLVAAIWGTTFAFQREAAQVMDTFAFNAARFALGALSLLPVIAWSRRHRGWRPGASPWQTLAWGAAPGAVLYAASALQQGGLQSTTAGNASFITGTYIVLVPIFGMLLGQRTGARTWAGVGFALVGLYLLSVGPGFTIGSGDLLVLIGAVFWAAHILVIDRATKVADPLEISAVQFAVCAALSALTALWQGGGAAFAGAGTAAVPILFAGLLSVGVAYTLQVVVQQWAQPAATALILSLETVFGAVGGALLLGEVMTARGYLGCLLILAGIVLSQLRLPARRRAGAAEPARVGAAGA